jgi:hypothetical protein
MMVYVTTAIDSTRDPPPQPPRGPRHRQSGIPDVDTLSQLPTFSHGLSERPTSPLTVQRHLGKRRSAQSGTLPLTRTEEIRG